MAKKVREGRFNPLFNLPLSTSRPTEYVIKETKPSNRDAEAYNILATIVPLYFLKSQHNYIISNGNLLHANARTTAWYVSSTSHATFTNIQVEEPTNFVFFFGLGKFHVAKIMITYYHRTI